MQVRKDCFVVFSNVFFIVSAFSPRSDDCAL